MYNPEIDITACEGLYNPRCDRRAVDQRGFIDLRKTFESGSIPGNASFLDERCNGVVDPDDMLPRPKDNFERMRQVDYVRSVLKEFKSGDPAAKVEPKPSTDPAQTE